MKPSRSLPWCMAGSIALLALAVSRADESTSTIKFSDPAKPGTIKVQIARGDVRIQGADTAEVSIKSDAQPQNTAPRKDGLRVLTTSAGFALAEKDNVVTLDSGYDSWTGAPSDFRISVPRGTNVVVASSLGGDVMCAGLNGDIEVKSLNGEVRLDDVSGGALVETTNGGIHATIREFRGDKPLSFTSTNGAVVLKVPESAKANVKLRTQNGTILTDFDDKALVTKVEAVPRGSRHGKAGHSVLSPEEQQVFREAARAGVEAARHAAEAVREATEAVRQGVDSNRESADGGPVPPVPPIPPIPPIPAIPALTGGKLVTGTLNGGGPEISITTMNGDVTLRRIERK